MNVLEQIAASLGRDDEEPNLALAQEIADAGDEAAVKELLGLLAHQDKDVQSDSIKVLYEVAELRPSLVESHCDAIARLLSNGNNRLVGGAMTALDALTETNPRGVYAHLQAIVAASRDGSVVTRDRAMGILIKLAARADYAEECLPLLLEALRTCPANQRPMYAEDALAGVIDARTKDEFMDILSERRGELPKDSQKKRLDAVLKKIQAL